MAFDAGATGRAGGVNENVDATVTVQRGDNGLVDRGRVADVGRECTRAFAELGGGGLGDLAAHVEQDNGRAEGVQPLRNG